MTCKIVIIGGGWYGCYSALLLQDKYEVILIEKNDDIFNESSYYNQNRLHLGYHYSRNFNTRNLCKNGFNRFFEKFEKHNIIDKIKNNYYLISNDSFLDYQTIYSIYKYEDYNFKIIDNTLFSNIHKNIISVDECVINSDKSKYYFKKNIINCNILLNKKVINIDNNHNTDNKRQIFLNDRSQIECDLIIDCTFNALNLSSKKYKYEKTISLLFKKVSEITFDAITIIDGPFFSLYPHDVSNNIYTLTDVEFTPVISSDNINDINDFILSDELLENIKTNMVNKVNCYYNDFNNNFEYVGYFLSNKTKLNCNDDSRECNIEKINNLITVNCGKITGIFDMEEYYKEIKLI